MPTLAICPICLLRACAACQDVIGRGRCVLKRDRQQVKWQASEATGPCPGDRQSSANFGLVENVGSGSTLPPHCNIYKNQRNKAGSRLPVSPRTSAASSSTPSVPSRLSSQTTTRQERPFVALGVAAIAGQERRRMTCLGPALPGVCKCTRWTFEAVEWL